MLRMGNSSNIRAVYPDAATLREGGLNPQHAQVPAIVSVGNKFVGAQRFAEATDFLIARAGLSGERIAYLPDLGAARRHPLDSAQTTRKVAGALINFLNYCQRCRVDWRRIEAGHKYLHPSTLHWAFSSLDGSSGQTKVSKATVAIRLFYVQHFLCWTAAAGRRMPYEPVNHVLSRGRVKQRSLPELVGMPEDSEVRNWLAVARKKMSLQSHLMVRLMLECGLRQQEARLLRQSRVPDSETIRTESARIGGGLFEDSDDDLFPITLTAEDGTKYGKPRVVYVPRALVVALHQWKHDRSLRPAAVRRYRARSPDNPNPPTLFFNERTGQPFSKNFLNTCAIQRVTAPAPFSSCHKLRHYFASRFMLRQTIRILRSYDKIRGADAGYIIDGALNEAESFLQSQLGHSSASTTETYRDWVSEQIRLRAYFSRL